MRDEFQKRIENKGFIAFLIENSKLEDEKILYDKIEYLYFLDCENY